MSAYQREEYKGKKEVKEKNWMPFVYGEDELYMVHSVSPHRVFKMAPNGDAVAMYTTKNLHLLNRFHAMHIHGGPPLTFIDASLHPEVKQSYYLGILHYFKLVNVVKHYYHFAYKMEAGPPFRICAVSKEIPLTMLKAGDIAKYGKRIWKDTSQTAYIGGLFVDKDNNRVVLSYGASDVDARVLSLTIADLEALFLAPMDCTEAEVLSLKVW